MAAAKPDLPTAELGDFEVVPIDSVSQHPRNVREHDIDGIRASIREHGFVGVIVCQTSSRHIIVGNGRWQANRDEGATTIRVEWKDVDDDEALRLMLNDNVPGDHATYEPVGLDKILADLAATDRGLDGTGWEPEAEPEPAPATATVPLAPLKRGHYLVSYDLDRHAEVAAIMDQLPIDERIEVRHAANAG